MHIFLYMHSTRVQYAIQYITFTYSYYSTLVLYIHRVKLCSCPNSTWTMICLTMWKPKRHRVFSLSCVLRIHKCSFWNLLVLPISVPSVRWRFSEFWLVFRRLCHVLASSTDLSSLGFQGLQDIVHSRASVKTKNKMLRCLMTINPHLITKSLWFPSSLEPQGLSQL